jgi:hypothetical protein
VYPRISRTTCITRGTSVTGNNRLQSNNRTPRNRKYCDKTPSEKWSRHDLRYYCSRSSCFWDASSVIPGGANNGRLRIDSAAFGCRRVFCRWTKQLNAARLADSPRDSRRNQTRTAPSSEATPPASAMHEIPVCLDVDHRIGSHAVRLRFVPDTAFSAPGGERAEAFRRMAEEEHLNNHQSSGYYRFYARARGSLSSPARAPARSGECPLRSCARCRSPSESRTDRVGECAIGRRRRSS